MTVIRFDYNTGDKNQNCEDLEDDFESAQDSPAGFFFEEEAELKLFIEPKLTGALSAKKQITFR